MSDQEPQTSAATEAYAAMRRAAPVPWRKAWVVFGFFVAVFALTSAGHLHSPDEEIMFRVAESLATGHGGAVEPIRAPDGSTFATRAGATTPRTGREYAQYGVLNSVVALPLFGVGAALAAMVPDETLVRCFDFATVINTSDDPAQARGMQLARRFAVSFTGVFVGAAICALLWVVAFAMAREAMGRSTRDAGRRAEVAAWWTVAAYGLGTLAWAHSRTFFSEPLATLCVLGALAVFVPKREPTVRAFVYSGVLLALAGLARLDSLLFCPAVGLLGVFRFYQFGGSRAKLAAFFSPAFFVRGLAIVGPVLGFLGFQYFMNWAQFGQGVTSAYADQSEGIQFRTPMLAGLTGFLFSIGKSMFLFSPAIVLGLVGVAGLWRRDRFLVVALMILVLSKLLTQSCWQNWAGGWCWGPRHVFQIHVFVLIPAVVLFLRPRWLLRVVAAAVIVVGAAVQIYGSSQSFRDYYILYFRTPLEAPQARVMYSGEDEAPGLVRVQMADGSGGVRASSVMELPAPINDSIYVPQNSQWYRYAEMWDLGYTDILWLRWWKRSQGTERPLTRVGG